MVKSQWLDDCFEKSQRLPEDEYNLKPQQLQQTSSGEESDEHEHELAGEEHHSSVSKPRDTLSSFGGEKEGNATQHKPRVVTLPESVGKRKRGRPSGTKTVKQKPPINRSQRSRPRAAKKPAKLSEYESDNESPSSDKEVFEVSNADSGSSKKEDNKTGAASYQPRTTRARLRSKPVEITENESDEDAAAKEQTTDEIFKLSTTNETEALNSTSDRGKGVEQGISESSNHTQKFDKVSESRIGQSSSLQRIEDNDDPIQEMLINIMPMLATTKVSSAEPVREEAKTRAAEPVKEEEDKEGKDAEMQTVKKRKVSYKDMANQLLKDW